MAQSISDRTTLRNALVAAFTARKGTEAMRQKDYDLSTNFLNVEETKRAITYGVVVTDETPAPATMAQDDCAMTVLIVIYARDETDVRAILDAAIEDAYETVLSVQAQIRATVWKLKLDELTTDEGTTIAKPHAQAVQRWRATHRRAAVAA